MLQFKQHFSSSMGNLYTLTASNGRRLLLECGVPWSKALKALEFKLDNIDACLITHEHQDHCCSVENVMSCGIDVYTSAGTIKSLGIGHHHRAYTAEPGHELMVSDTFEITPFKTVHDAAEPIGFMIEDLYSGEWVHFSMDSKYIPHNIPTQYSIIAIECSYDEIILALMMRSGEINKDLAIRMLHCHTSIETAKMYIRDHCNLLRCREIHLLHCSGDKMNKSATRREFQRQFGVNTFIKGIS